MFILVNISCYNVEKIDEAEKLRPEELNQQNIEALVAESNLVCSLKNCTRVVSFI